MNDASMLEDIPLGGSAFRNNGREGERNETRSLDVKATSMDRAYAFDDALL
jgi:hypothetical protein